SDQGEDEGGAAEHYGRITTTTCSTVLARPMEAVPVAPRLGRAARGAAAWLVGLVVAVPVAEGHAAFLSSRPAPGGRAAASPRLIVLTFSEPLNGGLSGAKLVAARSGRQVPGVQVSVRGTQLRLRPRRPLRNAAYVVRWRSVSTDDGHPLEGSF